LAKIVKSNFQQS